MKGEVFIELLELIEQSYGYETVDHALSRGNLTSKGIYTSGGSYEYQEFVTIVEEVCQFASLPQSEFLVIFGEFLFGAFVKRYETLVSAHSTPFQLIENITSQFYDELKKVTPEIKLPIIECARPTIKNTLHVVCNSDNYLNSLYKGLVKGCFSYYNIPFRLNYCNIPGEKTLFVLTQYDR